ncbi:hypothetical protein [Methylomicrobium sp. Wu6]|uniref:hypothetical protein n=1 Tax=Methylomicrobium sp. Wu6 TaxID=3107928 RepID=UPI002DD68A8F|nr:hypothetical protein [Methylomicrobium sp. Wu6]MEC4748130.1 hypothetical protein [Methylomicrobium sp. Wu6]
MHKSAVVIIGAYTFFSVQAFEAKPSFNRCKTTHEIKSLICNDGDLDVSLTGLYKIVLKKIPAA